MPPKSPPFEVSSDTVLAIQQNPNGPESNRLFHQLRPMIFQYLLYLSNNREQAEDLCQETIIKSIQSIQSFRNECKFKSWVFRIAHNLFIDQFRRNKRKNAVTEQLTVDQNELGETNERATPLSHLTAKREAEIVEIALQKISEENRAALLLYELHGYSYNEICDILGLSMPAVKSRVSRGRRDMIQILRQIQDTDRPSIKKASGGRL